MWRTARRCVGVVLVSVALVACGSGETDETASTEPETSEAERQPPTGTRSDTMRDIESTPELVAAGREAFTPCAVCHGEDARGKVGQGPSLRSPSFLAAASDDFLRRTISHGRSGTTMPPWAALTTEQLNGIIAYLRSAEEIPPAELDESPVSGDVESGERLFSSICAACHGRTGAGYQETSNGTGIMRRAFLEDVSDGFLRFIIRNGKSDTPMRGFDQADSIAVANLSDQEIDDIIAYLRANAW